jgi:hypothetical protein
MGVVLMGVPIRVGDFVRLTENVLSLKPAFIESMAGMYGFVLESDYPSQNGIPCSLVWSSGSIFFAHKHHLYPAESRYPRDTGIRCAKATLRGSLANHYFGDAYNRNGLRLLYCTRCGAHYVRFEGEDLGRWY